MSEHEHITTDHTTIKEWAASRGAKPSKVTGTTDNGILRFDFAGDADNRLEIISWEEFFDIFEENDLALLYQDQTADGEASRFNKLISRND